MGDKGIVPHPIEAILWNHRTKQKANYIQVRGVKEENAYNHHKKANGVKIATEAEDTEKGVLKACGVRSVEAIKGKGFKI